MIRKDSWNEEDDLVLAETVLRNIRNGSTQSKAFEEAAEKLQRSVAACSVRWTTSLKNKYEKAFQLAKKTKMINVNEKVETNEKTVQVTENKETSPLKVVFSALQEHIKEYEKLNKEIKECKTRIRELEEENSYLKENKNEMSEDYQQMLKILNKASQMIS